MTAAALALLADLEAKDVRLALADGGALVYDCPRGVLSASDREAVAAHRAALVALLAAGPEPSPAPAADREALLFEPEAALVGSVTAAVLLPWLRSARAGSAPEAGLAWLEARARDLAPGLGSEDRDTLVARVLGRLCATAPSPGRELAEEAWSRLGGRQEAAPGLPALSLYRDPEGRPRESWLVALPSLVALNLKAMRPPVVAAPAPGTPWGRADMAAGRLPEYLLERILADCPEGLEPPSADLLEERDRLAEEEPSASCARAVEAAPGRPLLFHRLEAQELAVLVPAPTPPQGLPDACPACRSTRPEWAPLSAGGRFLCRRCWTAAP